MNVLILNAGSSSQKSTLYELPRDRLPDTPPPPLWQGQLDWTHHQGQAELTLKTARGQLQKTIHSRSREADTAQLLHTLWRGDHAVLDQPDAIAVVGHRIVHGGQDYQASVQITPAVKAAIARLIALAPLHNPAGLEGIEVMETLLGSHIPQIAVFDTAFHAQMPLASAVYPIPYGWFEQGIRRYGFHGISHDYCAHRAAHLLGQPLEALRLIVCHLGNGSSLSAIRHGRSIDTTMGFTPMEGLMMGTRSGSIDPGILLHLMRQHGCTADELEQLLNYDSGLKGVSGLSGDMRQIMEAIAQGHERATLAFEVYVHRLRACIGAMVASLGGLDALVFTAGIGENSPAIRAAICNSFAFLGVALDATQNEHHPVDQDIATPESAVRVLVIHTQEDWAIAQQCWQWIAQSTLA